MLSGFKFFSYQGSYFFYGASFISIIGWGVICNHSRWYRIASTSCNLQASLPLIRSLCCSSVRKYDDWSYLWGTEPPPHTDTHILWMGCLLSPLNWAIYCQCRWLVQFEEFSHNAGDCFSFLIVQKMCHCKSKSYLFMTTLFGMAARPYLHTDTLRGV